MREIESVSKNLFCFFIDDKDPIVVRLHFRMAGNWSVHELETPPEPNKTNRLHLAGFFADLSVMTVQHRVIDSYKDKQAKLGKYPLRHDADPAKLLTQIHNLLS